MPGVWIQERFTVPFTDPANVNSYNDPWTTKRASNTSQGIAAEDGYFEWDYLWGYWNGSQTYTATHVYFAGTRDIALNGGGIPLASFNIRLDPGNPNPTQSVNANQTRNP